ACITLGATILAALAIAAGYSSYAVMTFLILMLATIGTLAFSQAPLPASLIHGVYTLITSHLVILTDNRQRISSGKAMRVLKVSMVPVLVAIAFFLMYYLGNPAFAALMNNFTPGAPGAFFWFCLWSGVFLFGTFYINENWAGMLLEKKLPDYLSRDNMRSNPVKTRIQGLCTGVRKENQRALLTLGLLNGLILLVNLTDLYYISGGTLPDDLTHSEYVHQGIYTLILSLVLAISLILFYFRGSLNFFSPARHTFFLTIAWLFQNGILALLCAYRNLLYVEEYGLTHKRIGVWVYIVLVLAGLLITYLKVSRKLSLWHLIKLNSTIAIGLFLCMSFFNWDGFIAHYNLYHARRTDFDYLMTLSDTALPVMDEFEEKEWWPETATKAFERRKLEAMKRVSELEWQSMTLADYDIAKSLTDNN
ncbi:MAG: DUF4173 domain-containing protein, partial [Cyclobacteriaceae bacterium]